MNKPMHITDELEVTSGTLLNFIKKQRLSYFGHIKRENNIRMKRERPKTQRKAKGILGEDVEEWIRQVSG